MQVDLTKTVAAQPIDVFATLASLVVNMGAELCSALSYSPVQCPRSPSVPPGRADSSADARAREAIARDSLDLFVWNDAQQKTVVPSNRLVALACGFPQSFQICDLNVVPAVSDQTADKNEKLNLEKPDLGARLIRAFLDNDDSRRTLVEFAEKLAGGEAVTSRL